MEQRLTLVTLGVRDLARAVTFYEVLGWRAHPSSVDGEVAFFDTGGMVVALWGRRQLAEDSGMDDLGGWGGVTLAHNVAETAQVDAILAAARAAGAGVTRSAARTPWGGYSGVFVDPDGHPWEVAVNPGWPLDADGRPQLS
ncbi:MULTISPECIES: VOC family protein [Microbacterium]|uniref:VOC family protein n=1 Tax=Microbacterium TaxID=33882 RepID=UPI00277DE82E|nr:MULTISPECIES: VOC family protein [Microbacterium]MDQ1084416.1 catechol 2,3-dioxygenase-like lactoylglutathione lyase family enzyme [Microbacterium sp. SORGH_AS_0344]MDQ1170310.1 catechol 2,3-dioxygenase-like lactoylglutathione lyase family enzyme [Microbacterium proteolyticum]